MQEEVRQKLGQLHMINDYAYMSQILCSYDPAKNL